MKGAAPTSIRVDPGTLREAREIAERENLPLGKVLHLLIREGVQMRRCPGIVFTDGPAGRRATVAGSGIDVWEVIGVYFSAGRNLARLRRAIPQLSSLQIQAALAYWRTYPDDVKKFLELNERGLRQGAHPHARSAEPSM